jgi:hypothetical protein
MVHVAVTATAKVTGGPTMPLNSSIDPLTYSVAEVVLTATGQAGAAHEVDLLPEDGTVILLAVSARTAGGLPAAITVLPQNKGDHGPELAVPGTLLVSNPGVLGALVDGGPRTVTVTNTTNESVTVSILAGLDGPPPP